MTAQIPINELLTDTLFKISGGKKINTHPVKDNIYSKNVYPQYSINRSGGEASFNLVWKASTGEGYSFQKRPWKL